MKNNGNQSWTILPLCVEAQFAPVFGILVNDYDADGFEDILLTGNFYGAEVINGQYDAFKGLFLQGNGQGDFRVRENGFRIEGDGKGLAEILRADDSPVVLAALNNDSLVAVECRSSNKKLRMLKVNADDEKYPDSWLFHHRWGRKSLNKNIRYDEVGRGFVMVGPERP